ncbi:MAG TPA: hypothetical protein VGQ31_05235 [Candidatus Limnocylindrales bacterium]|nr:hypothetical protein [Candidatus Limnocylindrales bacterium]
MSWPGWQGAPAEAMADPRRRRLSPFAIVILTCVVLAGCAALATPSPSATPVGGTAPGSPTSDACKHMTIEQASEALGAPIDTATPLADAPGCVYEVNGSPTVIGYQFVDQAFWDQAKAGDHTAVDVGDEAFSVTDAGFTTLVVRKGSTYFSVIVNIPSASSKPAVDVGTSVANYVLASLP